MVRSQYRAVLLDTQNAHLFCRAWLIGIDRVLRLYQLNSEQLNSQLVPNLGSKRAQLSGW